MGSLNRVELIGNLGKDPEVRNMDNGTKVATFSIATTEPAYKLKNGTSVPERTDWHNIVAWGAVAGIAEQYLRKGKQVFIEGKLKTRNYDDKNGVKRYITEVVCDKIVLLGNNSSQNQQNNTQTYTTAPTQTDNTMSGTTTSQTTHDDDLPF